MKERTVFIILCLLFLCGLGIIVFTGLDTVGEIINNNTFAPQSTVKSREEATNNQVEITSPAQDINSSIESKVSDEEFVVEDNQNIEESPNNLEPQRVFEKELAALLDAGKVSTDNGKQVYTNDELDIKLTCPEGYSLGKTAYNKLEIQKIEDSTLKDAIISFSLVMGNEEYNLSSEKMIGISNYNRTYEEGSKTIGRYKYKELSQVRKKQSDFQKIYYREIFDKKYCVRIEVLNSKYNALDLNSIVSNANSKPSKQFSFDIEDDFTPDPAESKPKFYEVCSLGSWDNNVYTNDYLGLKFTAPIGWQARNDGSSIHAQDSNGNVNSITIRTEVGKAKETRDAERMSMQRSAASAFDNNVLSKITYSEGTEKMYGKEWYYVAQKFNSKPFFEERFYCCEINNGEFLLTIDTNLYEASSYRKAHGVEIEKMIEFYNPKNPPKKSDTKSYEKRLEEIQLIKKGLIGEGTFEKDVEKVRYDGNVYTNDYLNLKLVLPDSWGVMIAGKKSIHTMQYWTQNTIDIKQSEGIAKL